MNWMNLAIKFAPLVVSAVHSIERIKAGSGGAEKKAAATELLSTVLAGVEDAAGKDLLNDAKVAEAVSAAIDAIVAVENAVAAARKARVDAQ